MATQVTNYQCPSCTGPLRFDGAAGKLVCDYCGNRYENAEIEQYYEEKDRKAREAFEFEESKPDTNEGWDSSQISQDWGSEASKMKEYECPSCGAQLICDETTSATSCPYCGNPSIVPGQFKGSFKPDYVIPFKLSKENAIESLKYYYKGKKFLPDEFTKDNKIQEIQGVYVPFWLFDGNVDVDIIFEGIKSRTYRQGDYRVTEHAHYDIRRRASVPFSRVPADASTKMPDTHMDAVEPFDYNELKPFSTAYLPGFLAERYDLSVEQCAEKADSRAENTAEEIVKNGVMGYSALRTVRKNINLKRDKVSYALMPVYLLSTRWNGENYLFAMNGQTGKFIGNLPVDKGKYWKTFFKITATVTAIAGTVMMLIM